MGYVVHRYFTKTAYEVMPGRFKKREAERLARSLNSIPGTRSTFSVEEAR